MSVRQIKHKDFPKLVQTILEASNLSSRALNIEITESMMQNIQETISVINRLNDLGVRIVIDDFGTGYSSLSVLGHLNIDYLKIDRSFINGMLTHAKMNDIIMTIINMAHKLHVRLVGESIENMCQEAALKKNGCDFGQGFFYSKPLLAHEFERFLAEKEQTYIS